MNNLSNLFSSSLTSDFEQPLKFIDLFAGLGGFHQGFKKAGGYRCVFASEIDVELAGIYETNFGIRPKGDIREIEAADIPAHDVMCAGFPCQPFSLAGKKNGFDCDTSGRLIQEVLRVLKHHRPAFVLLENVPNIKTIHDGGFWQFLEQEFANIGYSLATKVLSTQAFGIPQHRDRLFIVGATCPTQLDQFVWPEASKSAKTLAIIDTVANNEACKAVEPAKKHQLSVWQELLDHLDVGISPTHSIVAPEFGADYPFDFSKITLKKIRSCKGAYGTDLAECMTWAEVMDRMPPYTRKDRRIPNWLIGSVSHSRAIYQRHNHFIDKWKPALHRSFASWQILEWRGRQETNDIGSHIIQFRSSGIRVIKPEKMPALVAMTPTQIPIIGSQMRYLRVSEAAKLQDLAALIKLPDTTAKAFRALGNAVNAKLVSMVAKNIRKAHLQL